MFQGEDICSLPDDRGECDNYVINYHYDQNEGRCRQFYYGGCGGNENRFVTEEECEASCGSRQQPGQGKIREFFFQEKVQVHYQVFTH